MNCDQAEILALTEQRDAAIELLAEQVVESAKLQRQVDSALHMLASWVVSIDIVGTGWDDWDEHYKDAAYGRDPYIGEMLREQIKNLKKIREEEIY
jgi:hypothetical protein